MMVTLIIVLAVILVLAAIVGGTYNGMVQLRMAVRNAWAQIDVQLKRRYDLIPNLVETVKGYAGHEKDTLERVIQARNAAMGASGGGVAAQAAAENMLSGALRQLFALSEAYPNLKANESFMSLQGELTGTENKIGFSRQHYNDQVETYNTRIASFPPNIIAGMFGFRPADFFEVADAAVREAPKVKF
ncbi:MAG: LemA family protein [Phycisphaerae bacterium]|nr:LemA family protein [Phycisphaerae bacterium]